MTSQSQLQQLPAIEKLLNTSDMLELQAIYARALVTEALRAVVADIRSDILRSDRNIQLPDTAGYARLTRQRIADKIAPRLILSSTPPARLHIPT